MGIRVAPSGSADDRATSDPTIRRSSSFFHALTPTFTHSLTHHPSRHPTLPSSSPSGPQTLSCTPQQLHNGTCSLQYRPSTLNTNTHNTHKLNTPTTTMMTTNSNNKDRETHMLPTPTKPPTSTQAHPLRTVTPNSNPPRTHTPTRNTTTAVAAGERSLGITGSRSTMLGMGI